MKQHLRSFLTLLMLVVWASGFAQSSLSVDFESDLTTYTDWTFKNIAQSATITPHSGTYHGDTSAKATAYVQTKNKIEAPQQLTFYISKVSKNKTTSNWRIQVSTDGKTWNDVKSVSAISMDRGQWFEVTQNLEKYKNNYVRVFYDGGTSTATRCIDDITLTLASSKTPTTLKFTEQAISINGGDEASFKGQPAKLYAGEQELTGKTIKYAHTGDEIFATFDGTTGAATLKSGVYGTATVIATYVGDDTYEEAVASYTVKVKNPNVLESTTTYDFVNNTYGYPRNGNLKNGAIISNESPVTIVNTKNGATTQSKFTNDDFRNYKAAVLTINAKEGCLINKITITGTRINQLNLNGKDGTWDNGVWTGSSSSVSFTNPGGSSNAVCFETITIEYTAPASLTLDENADDTNTKIEANKGKTVDVTLTRSLKAGVWNTICLPFDVTAEQIKNILKAEGMVREYADDDATAQTITFKKVEGNMKAGEPYLIKPTEDITSLAFEGVTITAIEGNLQGKAYGIRGTLGKYAMNTDGTELFLNAAGKFVAPAAATNTMKGFRAYFMVPKGASAAAININIDGETTGINNIETNATVNGKVYNLNGQYVGNSLNGLKKGIYVVNGKKVIK